MNRRQLLKATLTGAVAAVAAPIASALAKTERGTAPHVASPTLGNLRYHLVQAFHFFPDADYLLVDDVFNEHFYPKSSELSKWFEVDHVVRPQAIAPGVTTRGLVYVKFKDGADKYAGIANLLGISRQEAKVRYMMLAYGSGEAKFSGTVTGRIPNRRESYLTYTNGRFHKGGRPIPRDTRVTVVNTIEPNGWGDYAELEARVLETIRGKSDIVSEMIRKGK